MPRQYVDLPEELKESMREWREGVRCLPPEYIEFHKKLATEAKAELAAEFYIIMDGMVHDGWMDAMHFLAVTCEDKKTGQIRLFKWADNQCWYEHKPRGGWVLFSKPPVRPVAV